MPDPLPRVRALLITSGRYEDGRLPGLAGPQHDTINLAAALEQQDDIEVLALPEHSTEDVKRELERFLGTIDEEQTVLVYYSGHGVRSGNRLYLATRTTDLELLETTAIEAALVRRLLDDCGARARILVLDCCYAATDAWAPGLFKGLSDLPPLTTETPLRFKGARAAEAQGSGLAVLTAASADRKAPDGSRGSPYTEVLIRGITTGKADLDRDGWVSAEELAHYAHQSLPGMETRHFVDDVAGKLLLTRVPGKRVVPRRPRPAEPAPARPPDLSGPAALVLAAPAVGTGLWLTGHEHVWSAVAGLVVGLLAYLGHAVTRWATAG